MRPDQPPAKSPTATRVAAPGAKAAPASKQEKGPDKAQTALRRARLKAVRPWKLRLIDAVALSAAALLLLKVLSLSQTGVPSSDLPSFARALANRETRCPAQRPEEAERRTRPAREDAR